MRNFNTVALLLLLSLLGGYSCKKERGTKEQAALMTKVEQAYPNSGTAGILYTIEGDNLNVDRADINVLFGNTAAEIKAVSKKQILIQVPALTGIVPVKMEIQGEPIALGDFTYQNLSVRAVTPTVAPKGAQIKISGAGLLSGKDVTKVFLGEVPCEVFSLSDTLIVVSVPEGRGAGPVRVLTDGQEGTGPLFKFLNIGKVSPLTGGVGTIVTVEVEGGEGLLEDVSASAMSLPHWAAAFQMNIDAEVVGHEGNKVFVKMPENIGIGPIVLTLGTTGFRLDGPVFRPSAIPVIDKVAPLSGLPGASMRITGSYFSPVAGETKVFINNKQVVLSAVAENEIQLPITNDFTTGPIRVEVNGRSVTGPEFKLQGLSVTEISPNNGINGQVVEINGDGFDTDMLNNKVFIGGLPAEILSATAQRLKVKVPDNGTSSQVEVRVGAVTALSPERFNYAGVSSLAKGSINFSSGSGSIAVDANGTLFALDIQKNRVVKIKDNGQVEHFSGSSSGERGYRDGSKNVALFQMDKYSSILFNPNNNSFYISDAQAQVLRVVTSTGEVSSVSLGFSMGAISLGPANPYMEGGVILSGEVGVKHRFTICYTPPFMGSFIYEKEVPFAPSYVHQRFGVTYLGDIYYYGPNFPLNESVISKTSNDGVILFAFKGGTTSNWAGNEAKRGYLDGVGRNALFNGIRSMTMMDYTNLLVVDGGNFALRKVNTNNAEVSTVAKFQEGFADGDFRTAKISSNVSDVCVSPDGRFVYLIDNGNNCIRKIQLK